MPRTSSSVLASKIVGDEIRQSRMHAGLSQAELARRLKVSPAYITNVEAGRANPTVGQMLHIANALGARLEIKLPVVARDSVVLPPRTAEQS